MGFLEDWNYHQTPLQMVSIAWLGQAGFLIKNGSNKVLALDVYLSDLVERTDGNKRIMPSLFSARELCPDLVCVTHEHLDHLDLDTLSVWLNKEIPLYTNENSEAMCRKKHLASDNIIAMHVGDKVKRDEYTIEAVFANHGDYAPNALGFIISTNGIKLYFTGDTSYEMSHMTCEKYRNINVMIPPINGEYGNMNERDAAMLAGRIKPDIVIPCHFWMFARHQGSPYEFETAMKEYAPESKCWVMALGEIIDVDKLGRIYKIL